MKKLIAISVVLALATFTAFADVGGTIIGTVNVLEDNPDSVGGSMSMNRIRLEGSGANEDGTFGAWLRAEAGGFQGLAWWKPIDQLKLTIGKNSDGIWGREGVTGWGFHQMVSDTGVSFNGGNVWGWGWQGTPPWILTRQAFYNGIDADALLLEITPMDMLSINIGLPYSKGGELADIFKAVHGQVNLLLDFGNISITYRGGGSGGPQVPQDGDGAIFAYFGLTAIDNIGLDLGVKFAIPKDSYMEPIGIGLGAKIGINDAFGFRARVITTLAGDNEEFNLMFNILPYYKISDSVKAFLDFGLVMKNADETDIGFTINPWLEIGNEWFPTFYVGFKFAKLGDGDASWALPIALGVSF